MRTLGWTVLTFLATAIARYAAAVLLVPGFGPPFLAERRARMPVALGAHIAGGLVALALGPWQLLAGPRGKRHRWMGRIYAVAVFAGGLGGLALATVSMGGLVAHVGFGALAILWLATTALAWRHALARDFDAHRRWMMRSLALTFAAVTLRLLLPLAGLAGVAFADAYPAIAWACWVPNLLVAEWWILPRLSGRFVEARMNATSEPARRIAPGRAASAA